jgi:probable HAF family extracellular repeat protein
MRFDLWTIALAVLLATTGSAGERRLQLASRFLDSATSNAIASNATAINAKGDVLGYRIAGDGNLVTVVWNAEGGTTVLGPEKPQKNPVAINSAGQVAGYMDVSIQTPQGFLPRTHAFLWSPQHGVVDIGTLGGPNSFPVGMNARGEVTGSSDLSIGSPRHAFVWRAGNLIDLGTLGDVGSSAAAINDDGAVVGTSAVLYGSGEAFIWTPERGMRALGRPPGVLGSGAVAINNGRQVTGRLLLPNDATHSFFWTEQDGTRDIGSLGGSTCLAMAMNNHGEIGGVSETSSGVAHVFLWTRQRGMTDLGSLSEAPLWIGDRLSIQVHAINESGQIVGTALAGPNVSHAFLASQATGIIDLGSGTEQSEAVSVNDRGEVAGNIGIRAVVWSPKGGK